MPVTLCESFGSVPSIAPSYNNIGYRFKALGSKGISNPSAYSLEPSAYYIRYYPCSHSVPAFTDSKPQLLLHCYRSYQFYLYLYVISRHYHLCALRKFRYPCHISRPKIKLGTISIEKWRVPSPFFLCQYIYLGLELRVRCYAPGLCQYLAAL